MDKIKINGKSDLYGSIKISGAKNSALPILVSSLLSEKDLFIKNLPDLEDIKNMKKLLNKFNVKISSTSEVTIINSKDIINNSADYDIVRKMRASVLVLGPLLSRFGEAKISLPGGCAIGTRPIDIHLEGLSKLGCKFKIEDGFVIGKVNKMLNGNYIKLPFPSVGATENLVMASVLANGKTTIDNAAKEPEVQDLINCLKSMGAKISGEGSETLVIEGVKTLNEAKHEIISDRIVAGTFIIAAIMLNKEFMITKVCVKHMESLINLLIEMGANLIINNDTIKVLPSKQINGTTIETAPYPGFPTDLQAQLMALMTIANGDSKIRETIFENRFMHVPELNRLGANIKVKKDIAFIKGNRTYKAAQVMASDLRASVSLVLAGLCAEGVTTVNRVYHLDRGYEKIEQLLEKNGPIIIREKM